MENEKRFISPFKIHAPALFRSHLHTTKYTHSVWFKHKFTFMCTHTVQLEWLLLCTWNLKIKILAVGWAKTFSMLISCLASQEMLNTRAIVSSWVAQTCQSACLWRGVKYACACSTATSHVGFKQFFCQACNRIPLSMQIVGFCDKLNYFMSYKSFQLYVPYLFNIYVCVACTYAEQGTTYGSQFSLPWRL